ncbi:ATP-dependent 6-phosphofructokinase [Oryzomonas japonica]|uniref:ATP-dependent 6-phosphofructokinase n=1 Tax=Oryzomonas japonica TaxID=2603858 RepID=A0A7J4ZPL2_9BACT|nr:ATP-dependent 6-phosphofructokinase [Oryzomonas japonica]KAB0664709.1 ATP-dependent 6-phosphofructokinase [Oryzomonas japonica]
MSKMIGILTSGGDSPGLNAAIRGVGKALLGRYGMRVIGFRDGFRGMMENRTQLLDSAALSGILTLGGTILGTSRDKPYAMPVAGKLMDMTGVIVENYRKHHLDALVCLGGGGTQKNAYHLMKQGLNVITLPKTIDNDVALTDVSFGYDTALGIATEAVDRLHSTAHSHHRILVLELMGNKAGWLALGAGIAGGADVILIPEIPYDVKQVAAAIMRRSHSGQGFSIVAMAEGAVSREDAARLAEGGKGKDKKKKEQKQQAQERIADSKPGNSLQLARQLEELTGLESRLTILGYLQRGGTPSAGDRLLATRLGTACADLINKGEFGVMVAARGDGVKAVPLKDVVGKRKTVPLDHDWVKSARSVHTCFGD